ncbi:glycoside hydrolase family 3 protein [Mucilaginibacter ginkgonis]|uniref:beta-N-acetylhexosaminidase n=1 Tax=Mucilaginibacter ginkgonis TaxID=2682091 RepID=A0A6I4INF3_9SPHI|nr:glycoside hydrolase family 3 N-terminal domain-containing protein [Mucilaginibacter ginkgonis]QQL49411.1 glycoside hydrolase family 3 [Mucilaginibacter ginkgonis]
MRTTKTLFLQFIIFLIFGVAGGASAQENSYINSLSAQNHWVDSVFKKLNKKQRVAQLLFVRANTKLGQAYSDSVGKVIKDQQLGGAVFFQGGPLKQAVQENIYQQLVKVPLLIAMDGEWGLGMRLDSTISYPYQMTLGAIQDNTLIYKMGQQVAQQFKRLGVQMNFAPDMDVNNNPDNPVINYRSFGDDKYKVAEKGIAYMQGMQSGGLLTTAKHFPGHGDTNVDSHQDLPQLPFSRTRLDTLEEYPFKQAIKAGLSGVMIAHMNIPALDTTARLPSTLSRPIVTGILKDSLGFKGLAVSDAMEMKGVTKYFPEGEADVRAFIAGNDILELSENSERAIKLIKKAVRKKQIPYEEFEARVKKVLAAKYWAGLTKYTPVDTTNLHNDLNPADAKALVQQLADNAITLLKGSEVIRSLDKNKKTAIVSIGSDMVTPYQMQVGQYFTNNSMMYVGKDITMNYMDTLLHTLRTYDQVIIGIHDSHSRPGSKLDFSPNVKQLVAQVATQPNTVVSLFANAYTITSLPGVEKAAALIVGYQKEAFMQNAAAKVITKQLRPTGRLPVAVGTLYKNGAGM